MLRTTIPPKVLMNLCLALIGKYFLHHFFRWISANFNHGFGWENVIWKSSIVQIPRKFSAGKYGSPLQSNWKQKIVRTDLAETPRETNGWTTHQGSIYRIFPLGYINSTSFRTWKLIWLWYMIPLISVYLSYIGLYLTFIVGTTASPNTPGCKSTAVMLQYFFLTVFSWSAVEGRSDISISFF